MSAKAYKLPKIERERALSEQLLGLLYGLITLAEIENVGVCY